MLAYFGPKASAHTQQLADRALDSLVLRPASAGVATPRRNAASARASVLAGNGIGNVAFGQPRSTVIGELERLLRPPHETIPGICGFDRSTDWIGLTIKRQDPSLTAQLTLEFKHSRLVGYDYAESRIDLGRRPQAFPLATIAGLMLGDTVARARHLYRRALIVTRVPQGTPPSRTFPRVPVGEVSTASGEISAGIQGFGPRGRVTSHSTIVSIGAGAGPNTPCH